MCQLRLQIFLLNTLKTPFLNENLGSSEGLTLCGPTLWGIRGDGSGFY